MSELFAKIVSLTSGSQRIAVKKFFPCSEKILNNPWILSSIILGLSSIRENLLQEEKLAAINLFLSCISSNDQAVRKNTVVALSEFLPDMLAQHRAQTIDLFFGNMDIQDKTTPFYLLDNIDNFLKIITQSEQIQFIKNVWLEKLKDRDINKKINAINELHKLEKQNPNIFYQEKLAFETEAMTFKRKYFSY